MENHIFLAKKKAGYKMVCTSLHFFCIATIHAHKKKRLGRYIQHVQHMIGDFEVAI